MSFLFRVALYQTIYQILAHLARMLYYRALDHPAKILYPRAQDAMLHFKVPAQTTLLTFGETLAIQDKVTMLKINLAMKVLESMIHQITILLMKQQILKSSQTAQQLQTNYQIQPMENLVKVNHS